NMQCQPGWVRAVSPEWRARPESLPLYRRGRLARDVIYHARYAGNLVDDAPGHVLEKLIGKPRPVRGHEIDGFHGPQRHDVVVAPPVAHDTDRFHRQEHCECLTRAVIEIVPAQLLDEYRIGTA